MKLHALLFIIICEIDRDMHILIINVFIVRRIIHIIILNLIINN